MSGTDERADALVKALAEDSGEVAAAAEELEAMGPAAVDALLAGLERSGDRHRHRFVRILGRIGDRRAVDALIGALRDPSDWVRGPAAEALGRIDDRRVVEPLIAATRDEYAGVRQLAIQALARSGREVAVAALCERLEDEVPFIQRCAAEALEKLGWRPSDEVRAAAVAVALQRWADVPGFGESAVAPLAAAVRERDTAIAAIAALGAIGGERAEGLLADLVADRGLDSGLRGAAASQLAKFPGPRCVAALVAAADDENDLLRQDVARALGRIGGPESIAPLVDRLADSEMGVRRTAAEALDALGWTPGTDRQRAWHTIARGAWHEVAACGEVAAEPLLAVLTAKQPRWLFPGVQEPAGGARAAAAVMLGQLRARRAVPDLVAALEDRDSRVREAAVWALTMLDAHLAAEPLTALLRDPEPRVRMRAAYALGRLGDRRSAAPLTRAMAAESGPMRKVIAWSLKKLGGSVSDLAGAWAEQRLGLSQADDHEALLDPPIDFD